MSGVNWLAATTWSRTVVNWSEGRWLLAEGAEPAWKEPPHPRALCRQSRVCESSWEKLKKRWCERGQDERDGPIKERREKNTNKRQKNLWTGRLLLLHVENVFFYYHLVRSARPAHSNCAWCVSMATESTLRPRLGCKLLLSAGSTDTDTPVVIFLTSHCFTSFFFCGWDARCLLLPQWSHVLVSYKAALSEVTLQLHKIKLCK